MTLNGVMAVALRYFADFGKFAFQHNRVDLWLSHFLMSFLYALQMPRLFTPPNPYLQNISSDLHELREWSWAARGEQLLHLLHTIATPLSVHGGPSHERNVRLSVCPSVCQMREL